VLLPGFALAVACAGAGILAAPQNTGKVERLNRIPVNTDVLRVKLPRASEHVISNGLKVLILEDRRAPLVSIEYRIAGAGGLFEPADLPGLAGIAAQMLREGTATRNSAALAAEVERLGASLGASSGYGNSTASISASGLSENFDRWFDLANDILLHPSFPADEFEKLRQRLKVNLRQQRSSSSFLATERFRAAVYGGFPAAVVSPTTASLDAMTPDALAKWHRERYAPQNAILGIAGDVKASTLLPKLEKRLAAWKRTGAAEILPANPQPARGRRVLLVDRPKSVQTTIRMGNLTFDRMSPDYIPMVIANEVIGGGANGRLFLNLREEKGYTYGASSGFSAAKFAGLWSAASDVRTEVTEGALTEFFNEIRRIRETPVPESELAEKKRSVVANFAFSLEDPSSLLGYSLDRSFYGLPEDYWDTYPEKIMAVTAADVRRIAGRYFDPENIQIVAVGDGNKIRTILEKHGPLEIYDTEGRKVRQPLD
jgi:zinc protease